MPVIDSFSKSVGTFKTLQVKVFGTQNFSNSMQGIKSAKLEIANIMLASFKSKISNVPSHLFAFSNGVVI